MCTLFYNHISDELGKPAHSLQRSEIRKLGRNHEVSIVFIVPGTKILEQGVVIPGTWNTHDSQVT